MGPRRRNPRRNASSQQSQGDDDEPEYEVQTILQKGADSFEGTSRVKYKVRWKGFSASDDTWEWADKLTNAKREIERFENRPRSTTRTYYHNQSRN